VKRAGPSRISKATGDGAHFERKKKSGRRRVRDGKCKATTKKKDELETIGLGVEGGRKNNVQEGMTYRLF